MGKASRQLDADRAARNRARKRLDSRIERVKRDMTVNALASRVSGQLRRQSLKMLDQAREAASGNRAIIAGAAAAAAVWLLRKPILSWLGGRLERNRRAKDDSDDQE